MGLTKCAEEKKKKKRVSEMGYFKVRAREQFVAPNEKADEINARVKCNHRLVLCLQPELLLLSFFNKCISAAQGLSFN